MMRLSTPPETNCEKDTDYNGHFSRRVNFYCGIMPQPIRIITEVSDMFRIIPEVTYLIVIKIIEVHPLTIGQT